MTSRYWCDSAWLSGPAPTNGVLVECDEGRIIDVRVEPKRPPGSVHLAGLTIPGLANVHSHAFHRTLRGATQSGAGTFWTWRDAMYQAAGQLDPDGYHQLAVAVFREMLSAGYTAVGEFHYLHHDIGSRRYANPNAMGLAILAAADDAGIRITLLDTLYLHGGLGPDGPRPLDDTQERFTDGTVERWIERVDGLADSETAKIGAAIHSVRAVDPDSVPGVAAWAAARSAPLHAHVSEQPAENDQAMAAHGRTPTQILADAGAITERFTAVHATHVTDLDISLLADAGASVCVCPTTERDLADGIGPTGALAEAGVRLSVGSDSHAVIDPFEETRAVELNQRLATRTRGTHSPADLWSMATTDGYRALGWDGGRIEVGALADFVSVDTGSRRLAGHTADTVLDTVLFAASPADVAATVVGGHLVVSDRVRG